MSTHYQRCRICGIGVLTRARNGTEVLCPDCKLEVRRARDREQRERRQYAREHVIDADSYLVIYDPDPIGGFPKGAVINREQSRCMLRLEISAFTPGTRLMNMKGDLFEVICRGKRGMKLVPV